MPLRTMPNLALTFEQSDIRGPAGTGGALWYTDRVMAEYVANTNNSEDCGQGHQQDTGIVPSKRTVLVLGCGGVPLSGLTALSRGWDVILTDLELLLPQIQRNVERNAENIHSALDTDPSNLPHISVQELQFGDEEALTGALKNRNRKVEKDRLVILCSECIWDHKLHMPLLSTIGAALQSDGVADQSFAPFALVAFLMRDSRIEAKFLKLARDQFFFDVQSIDLRSTLANIDWPGQVSDLLATKDVDLSEHFKMYRMMV